MEEEYRLEAIKLAFAYHTAQEWNATITEVISSAETIYQFITKSDDGR